MSKKRFDGDSYISEVERKYLTNTVKLVTMNDTEELYFSKTDQSIRVVESLDSEYRQAATISKDDKLTTTPKGRFITLTVEGITMTANLVEPVSFLKDM